MKKIFIHEGGGHYIGSVVIVICEDEIKAKELIRKKLDSVGLEREPILITYECDLNEMNNEVIYYDGGDY